jgi:plasmid stabilization system protein ParE
LQPHCQAQYRRVERLDERFHAAMKQLAQFPGMGHSRADVSDARYLFWAVEKYVIAYRIEAKELVIVRVLHGARDFRRIFEQDS